MNILKKIDTIKRPVTARIIYVTPYKVLKKGGRKGTSFEGQPVPDKLQGLLRIVSQVCNIGHDYTKAVNNQLTKSIKNEFSVLDNMEAKEAANIIWETEEHKWAEVDSNYSSGNVYQKRSEPDKKYLKIFEGMSSNDIEGLIFNPVSKKIVEISYAENIAFGEKTPYKSENLKQKEAGLEKQVKFKLVSSDNVKYLKCGDVEFDGLSDFEKELLKKLI
jgi:hypothetical protein